jgi:hypothetical protein
VRLFKERATEGRSKITFGSLELEAANPGTWGNALRAQVRQPADNAATRKAVTDLARLHYTNGAPSSEAELVARLQELFDLEIEDSATGTREIFENVSVEGSWGLRRLDQVLAAELSLVRVKIRSGVPRLGGARPAMGDGADRPAFSMTGGDDGDGLGLIDYATGLSQLQKTESFNILCIPPDTHGGDTAPAVWKAAAGLCEEKRAFLVVDSPSNWDTNGDRAFEVAKAQQLTNPVLAPADGTHAGLFFPRIRRPDPLRNRRVGTFAPCGAVAGVMARTDSQRGVWKAAAGMEASLRGVEGLSVNVTNEDNGQFKTIGVNCLRWFPDVGCVIWGSRTLRSADARPDQAKYVPVRRLMLFIEESIYRGTQWVVFEPNDEPLWAKVRQNVTAFMDNLFRKGAFRGGRPGDAYLVKCDRETTTQDDVDRGVVNILVGFAPLRPAEFEIIRIQQRWSAE